jgi:hypothetical protein
VLAKDKEEWYLLDSAELGPINLSREKDYVRRWVSEMEYMNLFEFEYEELPAGEHLKLVIQWESVMNGSFKFKRGGFYKR